MDSQPFNLKDIWQFLTGWPSTLFDHPNPPLDWLNRLNYPADAFALTATVLKRSGAYTKISDASMHSLESGKFHKGVREWRYKIKKRIRLGASDSDPIGGRIATLWEALWKRRSTELHRITQKANANVLLNLFQCMVMADEVSQGAGLPILKDRDNYFQTRRSWENLEPRLFGTSLCSEAIDPRSVRVLPKMHLPTSGLTIRSYSHHLALCETDEVQPRWFMIPGARGNVHEKDCVNVLIVPWPESIEPAQFSKRVNPKVRQREAANRFRYQVKDHGVKASEKVAALCDEARRKLGSLDAVIFPEGALSWEDYRLIRKTVLSRKCLLAAGVAVNGGENTPNENCLCLDVPLSRHHAIHFRQGKQHRWRLDGRQIRMYGLGSRLHPESAYWEDIDISDRRLLFFVLRPWLVTSVLICEDLARHDPVGELLRGVGPHLVIALLMDGPQLAVRWPGRYTAVLADDPGSSVLSVSSLGMVALSKKDAKSEPARTIALWKDAYDGTAQELDVAKGANALALTISVEHLEETSADGRKKRAAFPSLTGFHSIALPENFQTQQRPHPKEIIEDEFHRYLSPHEASALARLAQQDMQWDPYPRVLTELSGVALDIAKEVWRRKLNRLSDEQLAAAVKSGKFANLPSIEVQETAREILDWALTNADDSKCESRLKNSAASTTATAGSSPVPPPSPASN